MNILEASLLIELIVYTTCSAQETTTFASIIATSSMNVTDSKDVNITSTTDLNVNLTRITQPTKDVEKFMPKAEMPAKNRSKSVEFIPSPQLEAYIEYNKYPVVPAFPESKQRYSQISYIPPSRTHADKKQGEAVITANNKKNEPYYMRQQEVGQLTTEKTVQAAQDKQYLPSGYEKPMYSYYETYNYPAPVPAIHVPAIPVPTNPYHPTSPGLEWYNKVNFPVRSSPIPLGGHPYPFIKDFMSSITDQKSLHEVSPWKRAAKIFATILPIGLLISALTPTILTIGPVNNTDSLTCRKLAGRAEELGVDKVSVEKWSKPGCEARLLCETAIRDDKFDLETVKKLFWSFVSQNAEESETSVQLEAVSNAIKEKRCDKISCRQKKKKSSRDLNNKS